VASIGDLSATNGQGGARGPFQRATPFPCQHPSGGGTFDESARRVSHEELGAAEVLVAEGHHVRTVAERRGVRTSDLIACGTSVEVKSFQALGERGGRPPGVRSVANKILDARGQGAVAVLWAGQSGLSETTARAGYGMFCQRALDEGLGRLRAVRVIGAGFDFSVNAEEGLRLVRATREVERVAAGRNARVGPGGPLTQELRLRGPEEQVHDAARPSTARPSTARPGAPARRRLKPLA
jgi:hypothetical protein